MTARPPTRRAQRPADELGPLERQDSRGGLFRVALLVGVAALGIGVAVVSALWAPELPVAALLLGGAGGVGLLLLALRRFDVFVLLLLATRPFFDIVGAGGTLSPSVLVGLLFLGASLLWLLQRWRARQMVQWSPATLGLFVLLIAAAVSSLVSAQPVVSLIATTKLAAAIAMFVVLEQCLRTGVLTSRQVMLAVGVSAALVTTVALGQALTGTGFYDKDIGLTRSYLPFVHPNVLAKYLDVVLLVTLGYALLGAKHRRRILGLATLAIAGALVFTYARVGWATAAVAALYLLWRRDRRTVPLALVGVALVSVGVPSVYERISELWEAKPPAAGVPANSLEWRIEYWQHLIPMARISPINGLGYNMIQIVGGQDLYAHNVWVQTYVEMGLFGIGALLAAIAGIAITVTRTMRATPAGDRTPEMHIAVAVAISLFIMMQTENLLSENTTLWYAAAALTCGYVRTCVPRPVGPPHRPDQGAASLRPGDRSERATNVDHPPPADTPDLPSANPAGQQDAAEFAASESLAQNLDETETTDAGEAPSSGVRRAFIQNMLTSGGTLVFVFFTGVLTARLLTTDGRGQVSSITAWILTLTWASSLGFPRAMAYYEAKGDDRPRVVLSTLLAMIVPLGILGVVLAQVFLPFGFAAQTEETKDLARLFFYGIPFVIATEALWSILVGSERFEILNRARLAQPGLYLCGLLSLWALDRVTPFSVLAAQVGSYVVTFTALLTYLLIKVGVARKPDLDLTKRGLAFGLRLQGVALGELVTGRLDLMMLPAFVAAASVGFYSIAVNVTSMIMSLFGSLALVIFPMATRQHGKGGLKVVGQGLRLTLVGGFLCVLILAAIAPWLIAFVFGHAYLDALPALWLLLPGVVLWSATSVLGAGLQAAGRPGRASLAQIVGVVITVIGLVYALPRYGIEGAAAVSTVAYGSTFAVALVTLGRVPEFSLRAALSPRALVEDMAGVTGAIRALRKP